MVILCSCFYPACWSVLATERNNTSSFAMHKPRAHPYMIPPGRRAADRVGDRLAFEGVGARVEEAGGASGGEAASGGIVGGGAADAAAACGETAGPYFKQLKTKPQTPVGLESGSLSYKRFLWSHFFLIKGIWGLLFFLVVGVWGLACLLVGAWVFGCLGSGPYFNYPRGY